MHGVRSAGNLIFFLVLISAFLFSGGYASQTNNVTGQKATPGLVNETFNQSENIMITTSIPVSTPNSTVPVIIPPGKESLQAADETTTPTPQDTPVLPIATTEPATKPNVTLNNPLNKTKTAHSKVTPQAQVNNPGMAPMNPAFLAYQNKTKHSPGKKNTTVVFLDGSTSRVSLEGHIPAPVDLSYTRGLQASAGTGELPGKSGYPGSYDLRSGGRVSSVKNQGMAGSCWAFATLASLESTLLPGENWDFSENNMKNTLAGTYEDGFDRTWDAGGNEYMSSAYLTRWSGPVQESDDRYSDASGTSPDGLYTYKHIQAVYFIPERSGPTDNNNIKDAVMNKGAVQAMIYWDSSYYSDTNFAFFNDGSRIGIDPYQTDETSINHAITIVGWDDSYSSTNFATPPPGNGAFIAKNSWGSGWGDRGYFYMSYYDLTIGNSCSVFTGEPATNYDRVYSYDPLGWVNSYGYLSSSAQFANVFTAQSAETLTAIGTYETYPGSYTAKIYLDPAGGPVNASGYVVKVTWSDSLLGYRTIDIPDVSLKPGQKYSVVVTASTPGWGYPIPVEYPAPSYSSHAKANAGESYISKTGTTWTDITTAVSNANVCVKGYTKLQPATGITPGKPYNNFFYMWNHGVSAVTETYGSSDIAAITDNGWGHRTVLKKAPLTSPGYTWALVDCPLMSIASYNTQHLYIRYGAIQYRTQTNTGPKLVQISYYNGNRFVKSVPHEVYSSPGNNWQELAWDLGAWYDFPRGFNADIQIRNYNTTTTQYVDIGGYGAKGEFN